MHSLIESSGPTMSSREIAVLVESRHDDVKRSIDRLVESGIIVQPPLADVQVTDSIGRPRVLAEYRVGKRDSYIIVAQLSPTFTAALVDRWQELEAGAAPRVPQTMAAALRLAADQAEQIEQQQAALALAAPKVEFHDRYASAETGSKGFREVCKLLRANEREFREWLIDADIMYRLGGVLTPKAAHLDAGRFETRAGVSQHSEHAFNQYRFTPKGVTWVAGEWAKHQVTVQVAA